MIVTEWLLGKSVMESGSALPETAGIWALHLRIYMLLE